VKEGNNQDAGSPRDGETVLLEADTVAEREARPKSTSIRDRDRSLGDCKGSQGYTTEEFPETEELVSVIRSVSGDIELSRRK
jgi:hypothetical protein